VAEAREWPALESGPESMRHGLHSGAVAVQSSFFDLKALARATRRPTPKAERLKSGIPARPPCCERRQHRYAGGPLAYVKDLTSRNMRLVDLFRYLIIAGFNAVMRLHCADARIRTFVGSRARRRQRRY